LVGILLRVAFITLFERKVLGYIHFRKGPTKIFYFGLLQPISDALKLFRKEFLCLYKVSFFIYLLGPLFGLFLIFVLWRVYGGYFGLYGSFFSLIFVFCFMRLRIYFIFLCCWGSGRKYSLLGGYRSGAQVLSYEVSMIFFILVFVYLIGFFDCSMFFFFLFGYVFFFFCLFFFFGFFLFNWVFCFFLVFFFSIWICIFLF